MVRWSDPHFRRVRLTRNKDKHREIIGDVTFIGQPKYYEANHWSQDPAMKEFMVVRLDDGTEQKVMAIVASMHYYFEHLQSEHCYENVEEIKVGDRVVIEVGPRFKGKDFIHTNRVFKMTSDDLLTAEYLGCVCPVCHCAVGPNNGAIDSDSDRGMCPKCWAKACEKEVSA